MATVELHSWKGEAAVTLHADEYAATFLPACGRRVLRMFRQATPYRLEVGHAAGRSGLRRERGFRGVHHSDEPRAAALAAQEVMEGSPGRRVEGGQQVEPSLSVKVIHHFLGGLPAPPGARSPRGEAPRPRYCAQ